MDPEHLVALPVDVTDAASIARALVRLMELTNGKGIDVLINNAGFAQAGPIELVTQAQLEAQYATNVFGLVAMIRACVPHMRERGNGRVVNVSSVAGKIALPCLGVYDSTKFCVEGLSDSLRLELRPFGIDVVIVEPGAIHTEFSDIEHESLLAMARAPYTEMVKRVAAWQKKNHDAAPGPEVVAKSIVAAVEARRPKLRYVSPAASYVPLIALRDLLPARVLDAVVRRVVGL